MTEHDRTTPSGDCAECGATGRQIERGYVPVCEPVVGPHRVAIIALRRELCDWQEGLDQARDEVRVLEDTLVLKCRGIREREAHVNSLRESIARLARDV
jgi:hypothetical protein